jgi:hypothetical protein
MHLVDVELMAVIEMIAHNRHYNLRVGEKKEKYEIEMFFIAIFHVSAAC